MKVYQLRVGQKMIDSTGYVCTIIKIKKGKFTVEYESGSIWNYTQSDLDCGTIKLK